MSHPIETKGSFTLQIGRGHLTRYEINTLSEGDVVELYHRAGEPFPLTFNGNAVGVGEIVVLEDYLGVRITSVGAKEDLTPVPLRTDDLTNVLPVSVGLDPVLLSLRDLAETGPGTIVAFDQQFQSPFTLHVLGMPLARGKMVLIEENYGIRIDEILHRSSEPEAVELSGARLGKHEEFRRIQEVDFKRPDKFSRQEIQGMQKLHALFAANLGLALPETKGFSVLSVDQLTFSEFEEALKSKPQTHFHFKLGLPKSPPSGEKRNLDKLFVAPENGTSPAAKDAKGWLNMMKEWSRARPAAGYYDRCLFAFEADGFFSKLKSTEAANELFVQPLQKSWKSALPMSVQLEKISSDPKELKIVPENDMVLLVQVGVPGRPEIHGNFLYPYIVLESILPYLR